MRVPPAIAAMPRFSLLDGPSPLQRLPRLSAAIGGGADVWIKREDLLPLAFGGNKLRNLELLVGAALAEGADTLITSGRRWSNLRWLTAARPARRPGLAVHLVSPARRPGWGEGSNQRLDEPRSGRPSTSLARPTIGRWAARPWSAWRTRSGQPAAAPSSSRSAARARWVRPAR
jgi:D-cysteine desulfhydrase